MRSCQWPDMEQRADATAPLLAPGNADCGELVCAVAAPPPLTASPSEAPEALPRPVLDLPMLQEKTSWLLWRKFVTCLVAIFPPLYTMTIFTQQLAATNSIFGSINSNVTPFFFSVYLLSFQEVVCRDFLSGAF